MTLNRAEPDEFAVAPLASGDPIVTNVEALVGGLQEALPSGGPWKPLAVAHAA